LGPHYQPLILDYLDSPFVFIFSLQMFNFHFPTLQNYP